MAVKMDQIKVMTRKNTVAEIQESNERLRAQIAQLKQEEEAEKLQAEEDLQEAGYVEGHWQNGKAVLDFWTEAQHLVSDYCVAVWCGLASNKDLGGVYRAQRGPGCRAQAFTSVERRSEAHRRCISIIPQREGGPR